MEILNEIITNWYPLLFLISAGVALAIWVWAIKRKARLDIGHASNLILERQYRNGQITKKEYEKKRQ
jgi:hypothetical protein